MLILNIYKMEFKQEKRWVKNRITYLHFYFEDFYDFDAFSTRLLEELYIEEQYSILLKIKYNKTLYGMVGKQIPLKLSELNSLEEIEDLHRVLKDKLKVFSDDYDVEEINSIQLLYVTIRDIPNLKLKNINKVKLNKEFAKIKDIKDRYTFMPLTVDTKYYGRLITNDRLVYLDRINHQKDILNQNKLSLSDIDTMYLYKEYIIVNKKEGDLYYRGVYDCKTGVLITDFVDKVLKDDLFVRKTSNVSLTIYKEKVIKVESVKRLSAIKPTVKSVKDEPNPFIGSWDLEAFEDFDGYAKVYALGFVVSGETPKTYYLDDKIGSDQLVLNCINDMLSNKYNGYTFYTHNFGRYDSTFLIKILKSENERIGYEYYKLDTISRGNKIFKLSIKVKRSLSDRKQSIISARKEPGFNKIIIIDSLNLLDESLENLCESFGLDVVKGKFPHTFVRRDTLNYVGNTPSYEFWEDISLSEYNKLYKKDWNLKDQCLEYLEKDLVSLLKIMEKFSEYINRKYHIQVTDSLTISRLALNVFFKEYLKDSKLPIIKRNMFSDIKSAYYGGVTEVYKPYGRDLYYYDVNSLYPFAALNPIPGCNCTFIECIEDSLDLSNLFGFFYCEIETDNNYLGLLPVHSKEGLILPNGKWRGWYFSEELKYALANNYKIRVIKGYNFDKTYDVFTNYVNDLYKTKSTTSNWVEKAITKRLLNHLLGRFGMNIFKPVTEIVDYDKLSFISSTREVHSIKKITNNDFWISYNPEVDEEICLSYGLDYFKVCNLTPSTDVEKINEFRDVSLTTAAAVTAYARVYMAKIKKDLLDKGGQIYYTDTDSLVTNIPLESNLVGKELGQFKLECKINTGYFISNKLYCLILEDGSQIIKSKTVKKNTLSLDDFKLLYKGISIKAVKQSVHNNIEKGSVLISKEPMQLNHDSYLKRIKVYDSLGNWIDTKPLIYEENNSSNNGKKIITTKFSEKKKWNKIISTIHVLKNLLAGIFLGIIISIFILIYINDKFDEEFNSDNFNIIDLIDVNKTNDLTLFRQTFDNFINLFRDKGCIKYENPIKDKVNHTDLTSLNEYFNNDKVSKPVPGEKVNVLNEVLLDHIKKNVSEIEELNQEISLLKIENLQSKITILDTVKVLKDITKEIKKLN